ncbi:hypothetical protein CPB83DRAFT_889658 [Crepidotus variabilis]|uniref:Protein kinase domain-containing protein n=1 Tax=Crepidotus variabilis TaxID=179855 RepID=A0A9P6ES60_9AGAR|nr:hypothetical protein CPB83DRAFT_889658 [Crepidotus variabilis]
MSPPLNLSERAEKVEIPILKKIQEMTTSARPLFGYFFWEKSVHGAHICIETNTLTNSIQNLVASAPYHRLPVFAVRRVISVAGMIQCLHADKIMHGAVNAENILFGTSDEPEWMNPRSLNLRLPARKSEHSLSFSLSQIHVVTIGTIKIPLSQIGRLSSSAGDMGDYRPHKDRDYDSAPETLLMSPTCSLQTDI